MRVMIVGKGKMGTRLAASAAEKGHAIVAMVDRFNREAVGSLACDAVIDFSHPDNLAWVCDYVEQQCCIYLCGTTGLTQEQMERLKETAHTCPVFYSANFSYGVAVLTKLVEWLTPLLETDFDIEVVEAHHNQKQDAPSGTAKMLLEAIDPTHQYARVHQRDGFVGKRGREIGIHSIRGGTVAGEHSVLYLGDEEVIRLTHTASSRQIFVNGAWKALAFMEGKKPGFYTMQDMIGGIR